MNLNTYLRQRRLIVEEELERRLPEETTEPTLIHQAMRYACLGGGKRLRGILALAACESVGGDTARALHLAAAVEMIHAYSLVHDDLPCMDDDDMRRGRPSCHRAFDEATAVLAGDALLTLAFECLAAPTSPPTEPGMQLQVISTAASACGSRGLVGGQVVDMQSEGQSISRETLDYIHSHKTGALFIACLKAGALLGSASSEQLEAISVYGEQFGLAFQITDDILDVTSDPATLGKTTGSDASAGKTTYVSLYGLDKAKAMALDCVQRCLAAVRKLPHERWALEALAKYVVERDR